MGPVRSTAVAAFAFLHLAQGQRVYVDLVLELGRRAAADGPFLLVAAGVALAALLAPFLPVARLLDRRGAVAAAAAGLALFRVPMALDSGIARGIAAALVVACAGLFLVAAVGYMDRRSLAVGAIAGLLADQLLRLAGGGVDPTLRSAWLPAQAVIALGVLTLVALWVARADGADAAAAGRERRSASPLERRAGGLRLRAGLALGALLFLELHLLSAPGLAGSWSGVSPTAAAMLVALGGAVALATALAGPAMVRTRPVAVLLALVAGAAVPGALVTTGPMAALLVAAGHCAALLLVARTLAPASGRRSPVTSTLALALLVGLAVAVAAGGAPDAARTASAVTLAAAALVLVAYAVLAPRPPELAGETGPFAAGLAAVVFVAITAVVVAAGPAAVDGAPPAPAGAPGPSAPASADVVVAVDRSGAYALVGAGPSGGPAPGAGTAAHGTNRTGDR